MEAEFHAVWQEADGTLIDIKPNGYKAEKILFLPDPTKHYTGASIDNIRQAVSNNPVVTEYLVVSEEIGSIKANSTSRFVPVPTALLAKQMQLGQQLDLCKPNRDGQCHCGSGRKYRKCCGRAQR